ncbi:MAG: tetratricopeptide repeat protein [Planctomycetia bacterium]
MAPRPWHQAVFLAVLTGVCFARSLPAEFVYDARMQVLTDGFIHDARNWPDVLTGRVLARDVLDFNRPAQLASLMVDAALWGRAPFGYHLTSVLLHAVNVILVWALLRRFVTRQPPLVPLAAAGLFALHPLVVEAVCEPSYREDLLAACFTLAGLVVALGHDPRRPTGGRWRATVCGIACLLAVASKESGSAAPLLLAVLWRLVGNREPSRFWRPAVIGGMAATLVFLAARFLLEPHPSQIFTERPSYPGGSFASALLLMPRILSLYAQLVVFPVNLCADYGLASLAHIPLPVAIVVLGGLAIAASLAIRQDRRLLLAVCLVVFPLLPVLNLVPIYRPAADRYLYLPLAGVAVAVACLLDRAWLATDARGRRRLGAAACVVCGLLGLACIQRQAVWTSSLALWEDTLRRNPSSSTAANGLAEALRDSGRLDAAEQAIRQAIRLTGGRGDSLATLGLILDEQGREAEAARVIEAAVAADPRLADPDALVAVLAMERPMAEDLKRLQARRRAAAPADAPAAADRPN